MKKIVGGKIGGEFVLIRIDTETSIIEYSVDGDVWQTISGSSVSWEDVVDKPETFTPSSHTQTISTINNLQAELDSRAKSVNNIEPDTNGNITISNATQSVSGLMSETDKKKLDALGQEQIGSIILLACSSIPEGYLLCDGSELNRAVYSELFSVIGTTWGAGNGETTFNLPDFSGKFIRGTGGNAAELGTVQAEGLPNATGWFQLRYGSVVSTDRSVFTHINDATDTSTNYSLHLATTKITMSLSGANPIFGASNHVTPENCALNVIIKY